MRTDGDRGGDGENRSVDLSLHRQSRGSTGKRKVECVDWKRWSVSFLARYTTRLTELYVLDNVGRQDTDELLKTATRKKKVSIRNHDESMRTTNTPASTLLIEVKGELD